MANQIKKQAQDVAEKIRNRLKTILQARDLQFEFLDDDERQDILKMVYKDVFSGLSDATERLLLIEYYFLKSNVMLNNYITNITQNILNECTTSTTPTEFDTLSPRLESIKIGDTFYNPASNKAPIRVAIVSSIQEEVYPLLKALTEDSSLRTKTDLLYKYRGMRMKVEKEKQNYETLQTSPSTVKYINYSEYTDMKSFTTNNIRLAIYQSLSQLSMEAISQQSKQSPEVAE